MFRRVLAGAALALALFHVWLFAGQAIAGELADPARLLRWLTACLLAAGLVALYRAGAPIFRGRKAVAIWLLAALLHGPALGQRLDALATPALPEAAATLAQLTVAAIVSLGLALLLSLARARASRPALYARSAQRQRIPGALAAGAWLALTPRPPPLA